MAEENINGIFPQCPTCKVGCLLPFSFKEDTFEKWQCSNPDCDLIVDKKRNRDRY